MSITQQKQIKSLQIPLFLSVIVVLVFFLRTTPVSYAQEVGLSLSPPVVQMVIQPDKSVDVTFHVKNLGDPVILKPEVLPVTARGFNGAVNIKEEFDGPVRFNMQTGTIRLDQTFVLQTNEQRTMSLNIRIPEGTAEGDYYYTFLVQSNPPSSTEGTATVKSQATLGSLLLITVSKDGTLDIKPKLSLFTILPRLHFSIGGQSFQIVDSTDTIPVVFLISNEGNNLLKASGTISLKGPFGGTAVYTVPEKTILAHSQRKFTANPSASITCSDSNQSLRACQENVGLNLYGFFVGQYKLTTDMIVAANIPHITASTTFLAIPIKFIAVTALILLICLIVITFKRKKIVKHKSE